VQVQSESGASLSVHPGRHPDQPQEIVDFLRDEGADLSRVIMSHVDRTLFDDERLFRLADTGVVLELDLFGMETSFYKWADIDMPNDAERLRTLRKLIDRGHLGQIAISQDICYRSRLGCFGGHGYGHMFRNVVPLMRRRGFAEAEIDTILRATPQRLLTFV
jgi:phosphotriesterase-related protein